MYYLWMYGSIFGRINRSEWWIFQTILFMVAFLHVTVWFNLQLYGNVPVFWFGSAVIFCGSVAVSAKRWHDRNRTMLMTIFYFMSPVALILDPVQASGAMTALAFVNLVGLFWTIVECGFCKGTTGPNDYGQASEGIKLRRRRVV
jgi:uncharacterized membrane protein YhaH (DUF805 family)